MRDQKYSARADYRQQERQRTKESASLSEKFRELKSLTVEYGFFTPEGVTRNGSLIKYTVNPDHARFVFRLDCPKIECACGDFDLSEALAQAVAARQATATGEMSCQGWLGKNTIDRIQCQNILRYKFNLEYGIRAPMEIPKLEPGAVAG